MKEKEMSDTKIGGKITLTTTKTRISISGLEPSTKINSTLCGFCHFLSKNLMIKKNVTRKCNKLNKCYFKPAFLYI